jgi:DNA primase
LLGEDRPGAKPDDHTPVPLALPSEYRPMWERPTSLDFTYKSAMQYVLDRRITAADILRYQIGYCASGAYAGRIIIPSYDSDGKLNYFTARSFYSNEGLKYKNPPVSKNVVMFEFHINWKYPIVLCEGAYDAIAIKRNAVPLLGKTIPNKLAEKIEQHNVSDICLVLDNDALHATSEIAKRFIQNGKIVRIVPMDQKDPSEAGFSKMAELIKTATPLSFADLIKLRVTA